MVRVAGTDAYVEADEDDDPITSEALDVDEGEATDEPVVNPVPWGVQPVIATGPPHPEQPDLLRYSQFDGFVHAFRTDPRTGEAIITLTIPLDQKHEAFKLTDHMGIKFRFDIYQAPRKIRKRRSREEDDE